MYEILGTGNVTLFFEKEQVLIQQNKLIISGRGNYGLKQMKGKITDTIGNVLLTSDSNVTKYNIVLETHKDRDIQTNGDTVTTQTIADTSGGKFVAKLTNFSDGTGETNVKKIDGSELTFMTEDGNRRLVRYGILLILACKVCKR